MTGPGSDLSGRAVLVTDVGAPVGRLLAAGLREAGADVFIGARQAAHLDAARGAASVLADRPGAVADLTRSGGADHLVANAVEALGRLDAVVATSQRFFAKPLESILDSEYERVLDLNLRPAFAIARAAAPRLAETDSGRLVFLSSGLAVRGLANGSVYCATQGALLQLIRALALELAAKGIRVNGVGAGWVAGEAGADPALARFIPRRALDDPGALVPLTAYLASAASDLVTGQVFFATGGLLARAP